MEWNAWSQHVFEPYIDDYDLGDQVGIIDQYWAGALHRLHAEVEVFNRLIAHQGERGRENELALARILERLLPGRLGVGTGLLFDSAGKYSKQMDLLLYDRIDSPTILAQTNQLLHPIEEIQLAIEVKSRLTVDGINDAGKKRSSINDLAPIGGTHRPAFVLFAYDAASSPQAVARNLQDLDISVRPDLTCVLDPGFIAGPRNLLDPTADSEDFTYGVTLLHELDKDGNRASGRYIRGDPTGNLLKQHHEGALYPVVDFAGGVALADPSRALLLFCEILIRMTIAGTTSKPPTLSHYLKPPFRDIEQV
ncbi:hypothetical protein Q0Z83_082430 [Actinoplanes sichuanensis]|uniref:DUF6602 domain-containing protein n=1 Tax=Actinoplanes sichuanensis TaxID=512349 RepID=A0ABW4ACF9_9ACTN|nr:DUF6602 domain-containing protein [Actinoplanes sichuanensis]BEL10052.1 hypothetical protein Q0Z83_082430 [Actinoplanes sichuanensis]